MGGLAFVAGLEEDADVVEREACALCNVDDAEPVERLAAVAALARDARGLGEQSLGLVVADGRHVQAGAPCYFADRESRVVHGLDLKSS